MKTTRHSSVLHQEQHPSFSPTPIDTYAPPFGLLYFLFSVTNPENLWEAVHFQSVSRGVLNTASRVALSKLTFLSSFPSNHNLKVPTTLPPLPSLPLISFINPNAHPLPPHPRNLNPPPRTRLLPRFRLSLLSSSFSPSRVLQKNYVVEPEAG